MGTFDSMLEQFGSSTADLFGGDAGDLLDNVQRARSRAAAVTVTTTVAEAGVDGPRARRALRWVWRGRRWRRQRRMGRDVRWARRPAEVRRGHRRWVLRGRRSTRRRRSCRKTCAPKPSRCSAAATAGARGPAHSSTRRRTRCRRAGGRSRVRQSAIRSAKAASMRSSGTASTSAAPAPNRRPMRWPPRLRPARLRRTRHRRNVTHGKTDADGDVGARQCRQRR